MAIKYAKWPENISNGHKIYQYLPLLDPPKFTQIGIFGLKRNHLATLYTSPGANPTIACAVKIYHAMSSLVRFEN
jgi:hypothetical protein